LVAAFFAISAFFAQKLVVVNGASFGFLGLFDLLLQERLLTFFFCVEHHLLVWVVWTVRLEAKAGRRILLTSRTLTNLEVDRILHKCHYFFRILVNDFRG
jgi:hypothetical protein